MTQEEPWRLRQWPAFAAGLIGAYREIVANEWQPVLPASEVEDGGRFRLGGEKDALGGIAWVFAMLATRAGFAGIGWRAFRLLRGTSFEMLRGAATGQLFPRGFSIAAPAHRKTDAEAEEQCCEAGHHGVFGCRYRSGRSIGVSIDERWVGKRYSRGFLLFFATHHLLPAHSNRPQGLSRLEARSRSFTAFSGGSWLAMRSSDSRVFSRAFCQTSTRRPLKSCAVIWRLW